jgi:hypothetical protein
LLYASYIGREALVVTNSILQIIIKRNACQYRILFKLNNSGIVIFHSHCKIAGTINKNTKTIVTTDIDPIFGTTPFDITFALVLPIKNSWLKLATKEQNQLFFVLV